MIDVNELRRGTTFTHDNNLLRVLGYEHRKMGRGKATIRVKVLNIRTDSRFEITFNSGERVEDIRLEKASYEYLYDDGTFFVFMDTTTYEQIGLTHEQVGEDVIKFMDEGFTVDILFVHSLQASVPLCLLSLTGRKNRHHHSLLIQLKILIQEIF